MDKITFTSGIKPVYISQFYNEVRGYGEKAFVDYPWTYLQSVKDIKAYTNRISDCTMVAVSDGQQVFMMHLDPENLKNQNFLNIKQHILSNIDMKNKELNAILVGSGTTKKSRNLYEMLKNFLNGCRITFSELRNCDNRIEVGYSSSKDTYYVSGPKIEMLMGKGLDSKSTLLKAFKEVRISELDEII